ncbi:MAG: tRNA (cytidine(56)-2'-O)-methyltransferase [Candidatus Aenigmarchaeota archaeon]|nr:tRNA (cytidine(56)-2'-O)-methyltransferase [Candidatus Aenigmarchaeota archaeon]
MAITILRLGHRLVRDQRLTTHVFLAARALGAREGYYTGQRDQQLERSLEKAAERWGGSFRVQHLESPGSLLREWKGKVAHLSVYGLPFQQALPALRKARSLLVVVGGEKVPPEIYQRADWNLAVSTQPHSEVAVLAILLYELRGRTFPSLRGKLQVIPQERGKKVISLRPKK